MIDYMIVGFLLILLSYASWYDYKHKLIEVWVVSLVVILACVYFLVTSGDLIEVGAVLFFTAVIWGLPTLFGFGVGDFIVFMGLGVFLGSVSEMWMFYTIFIIIWLFVSLSLIIKDRKILNRKFLFFHKYPLIPVITVSFALWFIGGFFL